MKTRITHAALYTSDLERMRTFYETYFGAESNEKYTNASSFSSYFLTFSDDVRLEIMSHDDLEVRKSIDLASGWNHLAFSVGSKEAVLELTKRLEDDGYEVVSQPRTTGDGYFESKVLDPDGNGVEITL